MNTRFLSRVALALSFAFVGAAAHAADVSVSCEKRSNRSKISVDGNNLARGQYRAVAVSGGKSVASRLDSTVGDEVEFDFDSNRNDIAEGATAIPANFIVDGRVRGYIVNASGARVTPVVNAICRVRR